MAGEKRTGREGMTPTGEELDHPGVLEGVRRARFPKRVLLWIK